ncbi:MAG: hypothetical protein U0670_14350 [Anaerolineae bacterium]
MAQVYEIRLKGHLDVSWAEWLGSMIIHHQDNGETLLQVSISDQAALHGLLSRLRDLGITLISVNPIQGR